MKTAVNGREWQREKHRLTSTRPGRIGVVQVGNWDTFRHDVQLGLFDGWRADGVLSLRSAMTYLYVSRTLPFLRDCDDGPAHVIWVISHVAFYLVLWALARLHKHLLLSPVVAAHDVSSQASLTKLHLIRRYSHVVDVDTNFTKPKKRSRCRSSTKALTRLTFKSSLSPEL
jgi:hypothetical protein